MKTMTITILDKDLGEVHEVGEGEVVEEEEVVKLVSHLLMALLENLTTNDENLQVPRGDWEVGTATDSQGGVELLGKWSPLEYDELHEEMILVLSFPRNCPIAKCSSFFGFPFVSFM